MKKLLIVLGVIILSTNLASADLLITMVMDGDVSSTPRFIEVYNSGASTLDLGDFRLAQYANGSTSGSASTLSGSLASGEFAYLMATSSSQVNFELLYGSGLAIVNAAQVSGTGNDVYAIRNVSGDILDVFGAVGTDGTGQNWEYSDASYYRANANILAQSSFAYANPGAGSPGVGLIGWSYTDVNGMTSTTDDYAGTAPIGGFAPIPEPGCFALFGLGVASVMMIRRRMSK